jgi:hypothetical protein
MNAHVRIVGAAVVLPLLLLGFWAVRAKSFELASIQFTLNWVLVASVLVFLAGEFAYQTASKKLVLRLANWLGFVFFIYLLFQLSWIIDLSTSIRSNTEPTTLLPLTTGVTIHMRFFVSAAWSILTTSVVWIMGWGLPKANNATR